MVTIALKREVSKSAATTDKRPDPVPKGKYRIVVDSAEEVDDKYGGITLTVTIQQGDYKGRSIDRLRIFPGGKYGPNEALKSLVESLGGDAEADDIDLDLDGLSGVELNAFIDIRKPKKGTGEYNTITRFTPAPKGK